MTLESEQAKRALAMTADQLVRDLMDKTIKPGERGVMTGVDVNLRVPPDGREVRGLGYLFVSEDRAIVEAIQQTIDRLTDALAPPTNGSSPS